MVAVDFPLCRVVEDIVLDSLQGVLIADDVVVESGLPGEIMPSVATSPTCDGAFVGADYDGKRAPPRSRGAGVATLWWLPQRRRLL